MILYPSSCSHKFVHSFTPAPRGPSNSNGSLTQRRSKNLRNTARSEAPNTIGKPATDCTRGLSLDDQRQSLAATKKKHKEREAVQGDMFDIRRQALVCEPHNHSRLHCSRGYFMLLPPLHLSTSHSAAVWKLLEECEECEESKR